MDNLCYELGSPGDANSRGQKATILVTLMQSVEYTSQQDKIEWKLKEQRDYLYSWGNQKDKKKLLNLRGAGRGEGGRLN